MKIEKKSNPQGFEIIALDGDLDFHSSPDLRTELSKLVDKQTKVILIDLKKASYIDSSGLATFVELFQKMKRYGGSLILYHLSQSVRSVFEIAKLDSIFKLAKDESEAFQLAAPKS